MSIYIKFSMAAGLAGLLAACAPAADPAAAPAQEVEAAAETAIAPAPAAPEPVEAVTEGLAATDIHIFALSWTDDVPSLGERVGGVTRPGYDNQPWLNNYGRMLYSASTGTNTDIFYLDIASGETTNVTNTPLENEFTPRNLTDPSGIAYIHQSEDGTGGQIYMAGHSGEGPSAMLEYGPLENYALSRRSGVIAVSTLSDTGATLQQVLLGGYLQDDIVTVIDESVGRSLIRAAFGNDGIFYTRARDDGGYALYSREFPNGGYSDGAIHKLMDLPGLSQDFAQVRSHDDSLNDASGLLNDESGFFAADGGVLYYATPGNDWVAVADLGLVDVTRLAVNYNRDRIAVVASE
jgi:hypothetical protein